MPFAAQVEGRIKRRLGDHFGLKNFGVNLTQLLPGAVSALMHSHSHQDEFIYIVEGECIARLGDNEFRLGPGDCFGFPAGIGLHISSSIGAMRRSVTWRSGIVRRTETVEFPHDDLAFARAADGASVLVHKDGRPY